MSQKKISIVIPNHNSLKTLRACVESIFDQTSYKPWEMIIVDDGSTDGSLEYLDSLQHVKVIKQPHQGIAKALNSAFIAAGKNDVIRVHSDVVIETPNWIELFVESVKTLPKAGIIGAKLVYPDDRIYSLGRSILSGLGMHERFINLKAYEIDSVKFSQINEVDSVSGALAYYKREVISKVGGIDENYYPLWTEDDDFCMAARINGFKVYINPSVKAVHYTRSWSPTSQIYFRSSENIVNTINNQKQPVRNFHYSHWEKKWGWNPRLPDLNEIRHIYGKTELCWQIGSPMCYETTQSLPKVDACFVTWNNLHILKPCLESLAATEYPRESLKVYLADNSSTDGTLQYLDEIKKDFPFEIHVERLPVNTGAIIGWNIVIARGKSELVARLDDDIILPPDWLKKMVADFSKRPYAGVIGAKIVNNDIDQYIQCGSYRFYPRKYNHWEEPDTGQADYFARTTHVMGCCNLYRRDVLNKCGLFDLRYSPTQWDDPDHHIALAVAGYEIIYDGKVEVKHKVPSTVVGSHAAVSNQVANMQKLYGKWGQNIFEILDFSLDLSREGRFLPEDGDTSACFSLAPDIKEFPRQFTLSLTDKTKNSLLRNYEMISKGLNAVDVADLIKDHTAQSYSLRRDGKARMSLDVLHSALSLIPWSGEILTDLAKTYRLLKQYKESLLLLRRAVCLYPGQQEIKELLNEIEIEAKKIEKHPQSIKTKKVKVERLGEIGEKVINDSVSTGKAIKKSQLKVLMVNAYENRVAGGDMHQINKTKQYLEKLGGTVDIDTNADPDTKGYDIVHLWNMWFPHQTLGQIKAIRASNPNVPVVHSTIYWDMSEKTWAELTIPQLFSQDSNPKTLEHHLRQLANDEMMMNGIKRTSHMEPYPGYEIYQRQILERVDHLLPQSYAEIRNMVKVLGIQKPYHVIRNSAESGIFDKATPDWFVNEYGIDNFIIMIGLIETRKNQLLTLYALKDMGIPIVIIGRNYDRSYMRLCERYAPPGTIFIEHISHEYLASALKAARVHVLPSWMECASLANVEAALAGCSLVVSNRTSEPEYFQDNAYYCDPANVDSIRQAVLDAYSNYEADAPKRENLRQLFLKNYTWEKAASDTLKAYDFAIEQTAARKKTVKKKKVLAQEIDGGKQKPLYSVIIHANNADQAKACVKNLKEIDTQAKIIIIDDGAAIQEPIDADEIIHHASSLGAAKSYNDALVTASSDYVLLLDENARLSPTCLQKLIEILDENQNAALVNPMLLYKNDLIRQCGIHQLSPIETFSGRSSNNIQIKRSISLIAATGEVLLARRQSLVKENWLDESLIDQVAFLDLSLKLRARGLDIIYAPEAVAYWDGEKPFTISTFALNRFNQIWKGHKLLPKNAQFVPPIIDMVTQRDSIISPDTTKDKIRFKPQTREFYHQLLNSDDLIDTLEKNYQYLDSDLLDLVKHEESLSRQSGDLELANGLNELASYIENKIFSQQTLYASEEIDASQTLKMLLESDNLLKSLKENEKRLNTDLLQLIYANKKNAQQEGSPELADGLSDLAQYIENVIFNKPQKKRYDAAETLEMLLNSDDIGDAIKKNKHRLDVKLLDLIRINAKNALDDGNEELSDGLNKLASIIDEILSFDNT